VSKWFYMKSLVVAPYRASRWCQSCSIWSHLEYYLIEPAIGVKVALYGAVGSSTIWSQPLVSKWVHMESFDISTL